MKKFLGIIAVACTLNIAIAQEGTLQAEGKVTDVRTKKGIKASIRYSSVPTGSITGRFNDSTFSFQIFGTAKYQVTAEASGYNSKTVLIDPRHAGTGSRILRNIELTPKGETIRLNHLIFPQGKATIDPKSFEELDEIVQMMKEQNKMVIQLEGHTDNQGGAQANMELSEKRVLAVKKYLVSKGVAKDRIKTKAFGGTQPLSNEMTQEARAFNRRVEMRILND
ncbi:OmpA family protein [Chryseosolibacter indicus]|uniref:OmpA family protein n=1 Tax=Chryseosolibacter indicus TaxID=2782351 RepID=A0ABS5VXX4_9BACT|nr:OmpA family protein [Chryseosolibacter indicus]MBT1706257.1 OmpA family protein [Chryseosolibacter indicus]